MKLARVSHSLLVRAIERQHEVPRGAPKKIRSETQRVIDGYVNAHRAVHREEIALAKRVPHIRFCLFALDPAYQFLRHDVLRRAGTAPALASLTGATNALDAIRAVELIGQLLDEFEDERWAKGPMVERFRSIAKSLDEAKATKRVGRAIEQRARKHADLVEHLRHVSFAPIAKKGRSSGPEGATASGKDWAQSVVRVFRGKKYAGSAVFIRPDLVLTAGHVVKAQGATSPAPGDLRIEFPHITATTSVERVAVHPGWDDDERPDQDLALLGVAPVDGLGLRVIWDFGVQGLDSALARYGFPVDSNADAFHEGTAQRSGDMFYTADTLMQIPEGASGGPLVCDVPDGVAVAGVGTHRGGSGYAFIGLPLVNGSFDFGGE